MNTDHRCAETSKTGPGFLLSRTRTSLVDKPATSTQLPFAKLNELFVQTRTWSAAELRFLALPVKESILIWFKIPLWVITCGLYVQSRSAIRRITSCDSAGGSAEATKLSKNSRNE